MEFSDGIEFTDEDVEGVGSADELLLGTALTDDSPFSAIQAINMLYLLRINPTPVGVKQSPASKSLINQTFLI